MQPARVLNKPATAAHDPQGMLVRPHEVFVDAGDNGKGPEQAGVPLLCLGRGWGTYLGPVQQNRPHSHHLIQIAWSPSTAFGLSAGDYKVRGMGHVVDAGASHCMQSTEPVRLLFLDPAMPIALGWRAISGGNVCELDPVQVQQLETRLQQWIHAKVGDSNDPLSAGTREQALAEWLSAKLDQPLRACDAAQVLGLSEGRFLHWFTQVHGLPFRPYVRWLRLQKALRCLAEGATLTAAAYASGFSDSAHLSRSFAASFGIAPRGLQRVKIRLSKSAGPDLAGILSS